MKVQLGIGIYHLQLHNSQRNELRVFKVILPSPTVLIKKGLRFRYLKRVLLASHEYEVFKSMWQAIIVVRFGGWKEKTLR